MIALTGNTAYDVSNKMIYYIIDTQLSNRQREVLYLHYRYDLNQTEIAKKLNISQPTVSRHFHNGKKKLGEMMNIVQKTIDTYEFLKE